MKYDFTDFSIVAISEFEKKAAEIFADEIKNRTGKMPSIKEMAENNFIKFKTCDNKRLENKDCYEVFLDEDKSCLVFYALSIRGFLFAVGLFLRKSLYSDSKIELIKDITGKYVPEKRIRGHQIGYRQCTNTYDAWSPEDVRRHCLDSMFYGSNTTELMPPDYPESKDNYNKLMKFDQQEFLTKASGYADEIDMDISIWYPNDECTVEKTVKNRQDVIGKTPRVDIIFPPGGDPGEYPAKELIERCSAISDGLKKIKPNIEMWPSAQMPRGIPGWGDEFVDSVNNSEPGKITGVIQGPNRAMEIDELRRRISKEFPLRLYPDITHNLRCEYSVHYPLEDWHYSLAAVNGRESVNPRPAEYKRIHAQTSPYTVGSVSYSEGVNDDVNKMVWSMLEFNSGERLNDIIEDYARLFFPGAPVKMCADGIMSLEYNWHGDPADNPSIEHTLNIFREVLTLCPELGENWRFMMCVYRSEFDMLIKLRRVTELELIDEAKQLVLRGKLDEAEKILETDFDDDYYSLYDEIENIGDKLFELIGMQTSVERHCAAHWERGAVLETIDRPVTNRQWMLKQLKKAKSMKETDGKEFMTAVCNRDKVESDEYYFSFAEHGYLLLNTPQHGGEPYINFLGDKPDNENGDIPMELLKVYDHYSLNAKVGGLTGECNYKLIVSFHDSRNEGKGDFYVKANDKIIYSGKCFGGEKNPSYDEKYLCPGFFSVSYIIPEDIIVNGCLDIEIGEKENGCEIGEFRIVKEKK